MWTIRDCCHTCYIQPQFVLFPSHPWRKLVKGTCSQLRDPMKPLEGEIPYWEKVIWPSLFILLSTTYLLIRQVAGKKKQRTKGSSDPKLSEGKQEQILLPHDMLIRKTTIHKVLIQLENVKSSGFQDENLFLFLLVRPTILVVIRGSIDDILS